MTALSRRRRGGPVGDAPLPRAEAVVLGDRDLVAPLHRAGVPVTVVSSRTALVRFSRFAAGWLEDPRPDQDALAAALLEHSSARPGPAVLFYEEDEDLLFVSRRRQQLSPELRFVVPDAVLVERLVDKAAFQQLAVDLGLPVPASRRLDLSEPVTDLDLPVLVKPLRRTSSWDAMTSAKAVFVEDGTQFDELRARLLPDHSAVVVQQHIPGPETRIESYHVYVDDEGEIAAEFTGRKVRTYPSALGHSTALETTDKADVAAVGRDVIRTIGLRGVAKLDFKRDAAGRLWLLEINPRFNLWHHVGAAAGVNIPAIVWADLVGSERPPSRQCQPGVRWCRVQRDFLAAREEGMSLTRWLRWAAGAETSSLDLSDPAPLLAKGLLPVHDRLRRRPDRTN